MARIRSNDEGMWLGERFIPMPRTISAEAQAFLANPMFQSPPASPALDDAAGWKAYAAGIDAAMIAAMKANVHRTPGTLREHRLAHGTLFEAIPEALRPGGEDRAVLNIHGGAFICGGGEAAALAGVQLAGRTGLKCYSLDYRMPPDHPFPAAVEDSCEALRFVLARHDPAHVALYGGSAGANLVAVAVWLGRDEGLPLPAACVLHSPGSDLSGSGDSQHANADLDVVLGGGDGAALRLYAGGHDLADPRLSPIHADYTPGFPPTILTTGTRDLLLSDTVRLHRKLRRAGIAAELHVWEAMCHGLAHDAPEAREVLGEQVAFIHRHLGLG